MEGRWNNLPKDILGLIVDRLNQNDFDILHLRAVCSSWRSSIPLSKPSPFKLSPGLIEMIADFSATESKYVSYYEDQRFPFKIKLRTMLCLSPPENCATTVLGPKFSDWISISETSSWIIQVEEGWPKHLRLLEPFSFRSEACFDKHRQHYGFPYVQAPDLNLMNYRIFVIDQSYFFDYTSFKFVVRDVIFETTNEGFVMFLLIVPDKVWRSGDIEFRKYGTREWVPIAKGPDHDGFVEMRRHKNRNFALNDNGGLAVIDMGTCEVVQTFPPLNDPIWDEDTHVCMKEFNGCLYLLLYNESGNFDLSVHIVDEDNGISERTNDLCGGAFFVCRNYAFKQYTHMYCISAEDVDGLKADCVFL